jgi:muramoyltetrapeptide carboxypeptidase
MKPPKLRSGDTIGIIAPCLPVLSSFRENYERGKRVIEAMGFKIKEGKTVSLQHWYSAGTPKQQAADINAMFADPEVKAVIAASGGHSAISVLELLDYELIRKHPKPFIGMSDMTGYHLALYTQTGLVGFHMDEVIWGIGWNWSKEESKHADNVKQMYVDALTKDQPLGVIPHITPWESWRDGVAEGKLIGGNLNSMTYQMGTPYFPKPEAFDGALLFWESVGQPKYAIMQSLYQLKYYRILERVSGMLIGTISDIPPLADKEVTEPDIKDIVLEVTKSYDFPIMANMDFGHYTMNVPMPIGVNGYMDAGIRKFMLTEGTVE